VKLTDLHVPRYFSASPSSMVTMYDNDLRILDRHKGGYKYRTCHPCHRVRSPMFGAQIPTSCRGGVGTVVQLLFNIQWS
jgi:hypothetical protein